MKDGGSAIPTVGAKGDAGVDAWWSSLDDAWLAVLKKAKIKSATDAKKAMALKESYIDDESEVTSLEPLRPLTRAIVDIGVLAALPARNGSHRSPRSSGS